MKKILKISYLALAFMFIGSLTLSAQIKPSAKKKTDEPTEQTEDSKPSTTTKKKTTAKKTDDYFDESGGFKHRLWYGGGFNLGWSNSNNSNNSNSSNSSNKFSFFAIGITPMVGYKIIGGLSAGPRVGVNYRNIKFSNTQSKTSSVSLTDFSLGAFTRYKAFQNFFVQAEYEYQSVQLPVDDSFGRIQFDADGKPIIKRSDRTNYNGGIGYNSGGIVGYEIMVLYNFNIPTNSPEQPFSLRFGLTYKF